MTNRSEGLVAAYQEMLARYVDLGQEHQLEAAYVLGRESFASGASVLELLELHRTAVEHLLEDGPVAARPGKLLTSFGFLAEALGTFQMAQSGYQEAQERVHLEQARAAREHAVALRLQEDLLPAAAPSVPSFDVAVHYQAGEVGSHAGGDWYDVFAVEGGARSVFVVGDVTGHGVEAAAAMGQIRVAVLAYALAGFPPGQVISGVDSLLGHLETDHLATMVYVLADPQRGRLELVNAGHPPPLVIAPGGVVRDVSSGHGRLLGMRPPVDVRPSAEAELAPGSLLLLYTDGLIERAERRGRDGISELVDAVTGFDGGPADLSRTVLERLAPSGAGDDICVVAAEVLG